MLDLPFLAAEEEEIGAQLPASAVLTEAAAEQSARRCVAVQEKGRRPPARKDLDGTRLRGCEGGEEDQCTGRLWGEGVHRLGRGLGSSVLFSSGECNSPFVLKDTFSKFFDP